MHEVVSKQEWLQARKELLSREKKFSHEREDLSRARRELPWVKVEKDYAFETRSGKVTMAELFGDRSQLIVYHFMLGPDMDQGCPGCSFMMDNLPANRAHLNQKDLKFVAVSRAPLKKIESYKERMGWDFDWVSSNGSTFNYDFSVSFSPEEIKQGKAEYNYGSAKVDFEEQPGLSVFYKDEKGRIYHTYSTFARGLDDLLPTYHYLDLTPKGRDESGTMSWVKRHDEYE